MGDFLRTALEALAYFWPLRIVHAWEAGLYIVNGTPVRPWRIVRWSRGPSPDGVILRPGLYFTIPWFVDVHTVGLAWDAVESGRIDLVLKDDRVLSCAVVAQMRVSDPQAAYIGFQDYGVDRIALLRAAVADTLAAADAERFTSDRRGRLLGQSLLAAVQDMARAMGHEVRSVQVTTFVLQPRVFRLLS